MALVGKEESITQEGGVSKPQFVATFDNGTLDQLEELKNFFKQADKTELVKLAISLLQRTKEAREAAQKPQ